MKRNKKKGHNPDTDSYAIRREYETKIRCRTLYSGIANSICKSRVKHYKRERGGWASYSSSRLGRSNFHDRGRTGRPMKNCQRRTSSDVRMSNLEEK